MVPKSISVIYRERIINGTVHLADSTSKSEVLNLRSRDLDMVHGWLSGVNRQDIIFISADEYIFPVRRSTGSFYQILKGVYG